ncbi:MAG: hypothetical protein QXS85_06365 [Acidilobaceae archaeon]
MQRAIETIRYERLISLLALVATRGSYTVLDRLARAYDKDMVGQAVYEAIRSIAPDVRKCVEWEEGRRVLSGDDEKECMRIKEALGGYAIPEDEINMLLEDIGRGRLYVARRIAIQALSKALSMTAKPSQSGEQESTSRQE